MSEDSVQRISRYRAVAAEAAKELHQATDPDDGQVQWEQFLLNWRAAWDKASSYCISVGRDEIQSEHHKKRLSDPVANYAWAARNAEQHDHLGSSDARHGVYVQHQITIGGEALFMGGEPVTMSASEDVLVAVPVKTMSGAVVEPPAGLEPNAIALHALVVLDAFLAEAMKE